MTSPLLTESQLSAMLHTNPNAGEWLDAMNEHLPRFNITTPHRVAGFISQCGHESGDFKNLEENLNYREETLLRVFPRYFGPGKENPADYARNPQKLANYVYMDKHRSAAGALGNVHEGDGWLFRGKGLKQVTGRANHEAFGKLVGMTAEQAAEYLLTKDGALESALWFWDSRNLNPIADTGDIAKLTKIINGGDIGLDDRRTRYLRAMNILAMKPGDTVQRAAPEVSGTTLRRGDKGDAVTQLQKKLGMIPDGNFGPATESAVKRWQRANGLTEDGVVGPKTLAKMMS
jgi:putative chitinase